MQIHSHTLLEIMYAANNYFMVLFPDKNGVPEYVRIKQGEYILINTAVYHSLVTRNKEAQIINLEFQLVENDELAAPLSELYDKSTVFRQFVDLDVDYAIIDDHGQILSILQRMHSAMILDETSAPEDHTCDFLLNSLTTQLLLESASSYALNLDKRGAHYVRQAIDYINEHFDEDIRVGDIAEHININATYLESLFKRHTRSTLTNYVNRQRIAKATSYLSGTKMSVIEIGFAVGYNSRQHFNRVFRQLMHTSPGEYRRQIHSAEYKNYEDDDKYVIDKYTID